MWAPRSASAGLMVVSGSIRRGYFAICEECRAAATLHIEHDNKDREQSRITVNTVAEQGPRGKGMPPAQGTPRFREMSSLPRQGPLVR
jgi:hypothetical protein